MAVFARSVFHLSLTGDDGRPTGYSVDVKYWQQTDNGNGKVHLYRDGRHHAESELPRAIARGWIGRARR